MERVVDILTNGRWSLGLAEDSIRLSFDDRFRRRRRYVSVAGREFLLDLREPRLLRDGDGLVLDSGIVVAIEEQDEDLLEVASGDAGLLARLAWHLGNRHAAVEFAPGRLRLRDEAVLAALLDSLRVSYQRVRAGFNPETGAPAGAHADGHLQPAGEAAEA
jgi:urease accessory protein